MANLVWKRGRRIDGFVRDEESFVFAIEKNLKLNRIC